MHSARDLHTASYKDNLFQALSPPTLKEFLNADGGELTGSPCKMQALHSSSALCVNVFDYWRSRSSSSSAFWTELAKSLEIPSKQISNLSFEAQLAHGGNHKKKIFPRKPNLDALIQYNKHPTITAVGIESKFTEAYYAKPKGLKDAYIKESSLWTDLPKLKMLAQEISPQDQLHRHLHGAQLIKHILALKHNYDKRFRLLYLWYDVLGPEGHKHRKEITQFARIAKQDNVIVQFRSYQELLLSFKEKPGDLKHQAYLKYMWERYV